MSTLNEAIFKECLIESTMQEIREIEAMNYQISADEDFKGKILSTVSRARQCARSKRLSLSLIAAIIACLSILLSVSARVRTAVAGFFVEIYDTFAVFFVDGDEDGKNPTTIETEYEAAYFKESGYEQISQSKHEVRIFTTWANEHATIDLSQYTINENDITLDAEGLTYEVAFIGEHKAYYTVKNGTCFVKWIEYGYSFTLRCDSFIEWSEIEKIVCSLRAID